MLSIVGILELKILSLISYQNTTFWYISNDRNNSNQYCSILLERKMNLVFSFFVLIVTVGAIPRYEQPTCGYEACPKVDPNVLNVHIVPHSHDDVGWLKTVDQYYYGSRSNIQHAGVQFILDSVIQALLLSPERRFIQVETAFFWQWWQEQSDEIQEQVRFLVNNGQLEIIGGAWSMNDEAASHYHSTIDQFTWGFRRLMETLGKCAKPKIGWQIDPFGHSREQASLFAQMGFDGLFFARLDYRDKAQRMKTKTAEFLWQGSQNLGPSSQIFTHVLHDHYMSPAGFCFDVMCPDTPIINNKKSPEYNAETKAKIFLNYMREQSKHYNTNNVIVTMGGDFHYQDSLSYFMNMDRLMSAMREVDPMTNVFYSTPSCYLKAVNAAGKTYKVKTDDFFPYASDPNSYWTGYFSSRPTSKRMERQGNNLLQVTKQLSTVAFFNSFAMTSGLIPLREAMGIMQHHDAITGTEKQHVADDYHRILHDAMQSSMTLAGDALRELLHNRLEYKSCLMLNISQCEATEQNDKFLVTIYNPTSHVLHHYVRIPVPNKQYRVTDVSGAVVEVQKVPIFSMITNIPGRTSSATHELVFRAEHIDPMGVKIFYVQHVPGFEKYYSKRIFGTDTKTRIKLKRNTMGYLRSYVFEDANLEVMPNFMYYNGEVGNNMVAKNRSSGAYIFRPHEEFPFPVLRSGKAEIYSGPHVVEYFEQFTSWAGRITRVYEKENFVENNWIVGPIPVDGIQGKEVITTYTTNLNTDKTFYTDSNGREMIKRKIDHRSDYNLTNEEPISRNYYPVTSKISLVDENRNLQMSVLNDRAQGGSSLNEGQIELMVHRRLLHDDDFGVAEALNEQAFGSGLVAVGKHYITVAPIKNPNDHSASAKERILASKLLLSPWMFISPLADNFNPEYVDLSSFEIKILKRSLPENIQILTLETWADNLILLRLEHIMEKNDDSVLSQPATVDLKTIFSHIKEVREMTLGANELKSDVNRLKWLSEFDYYYNYGHSNLFRNINSQAPRSPSIVVLNPMEIKTFLIKIA